MVVWSPQLHLAVLLNDEMTIYQYGSKPPSPHNTEVNMRDSDNSYNKIRTTLYEIWKLVMLWVFRQCTHNLLSCIFLHLSLQNSLDFNSVPLYDALIYRHFGYYNILQWDRIMLGKTQEVESYPRPSKDKAIESQIKLKL